jgi:cation:H+ antiporter
VLLAVGIEGFVCGSTSMALRLGVTPLVIGLTVVAFSTGSSELSVSVEAAYRSDSSIALGNVIWSNILGILGRRRSSAPSRLKTSGRSTWALWSGVRL